MARARDVAVPVGSLRRESLNRKLQNAAVLFVTPEYSRSVPGSLKNAIDVGSRPYGHSVFDRTPAAVASLSPGAISGFGANHHLRQSLVFLDMPTLQQPEVYIGGAGDLFDQSGRITKEATSTFLWTLPGTTSGQLLGASIHPCTNRKDNNQRENLGYAARNSRKHGTRSQALHRTVRSIRSIRIPFDCRTSPTALHRTGRPAFTR